MGAGRYVGRVGALAVALGVGAAVTVGAGVAWADDSGSSSASSSPARHAPHQSHQRSEKREHGAPSSAASSEGAADSPTPKTSKVKRSSRKSKAKDVSSSDASKRVVKGKGAQSVVAVKPAAADAAAAPRAASVAAAVALASVPAAGAVSAPAPVSAVSVAAPVSAVSSSVGTSSAASALAVLFGGGSGAPALAPVSWVLAAAARRELGAAKAEVLSTGVAAAASPAGVVPVAATANHKPVFDTPAVGSPDSSGVVTGSVKAVDADGDSLTYTVGKAGKGSVAVDAVTGAFTYTPSVSAMHAASVTGAKASALSDSFAVKVSDGQGGSATQAVTVAVAPVNAAPTVSSDLVVTKTNASTGVVTGTITVTDADKDALTYSGSAVNGKVTVSSKGVFTYTPTVAARHAAAADGPTTDAVTLTVSDGHGGSVTQSVSVDITPKNSAPSVSVSAGKANASTGVVTGAIKVSDADKDSVSVSVDSTSAKGGLVSYDSASGKYAYAASDAARHAAAASGASKADKADTFMVTVDDGHGGVVTKVVTVTVAGANTAPPKTTASVNSPDATGVVTGTLNVSDAEGDSLTYSASKPKKGTVTVDPDGSFTYTASAAAMHAASAVNAKASVLSDTFTVKVTDGHGGATTQTVTVAIAPADAAPTVTTDLGVSKTNASTGVVTGTIKVADADKDSLKYTATADNGKVTVSSNGAFTYTPTVAARHAAAAGGPTTDTVTVTVSDGHGGSVTQSVSVDITPKNTNPSLSVTAGKPDASTGAVTGMIKVTDADKDSVTVSVDSTSAKDGAIIYNSTTGTYTYTPTEAARNAAAVKNAPSSAKSDTFTVTVDDGHGAMVSKVVTVSVSPKAGPLNTAPINGTAHVNAPDPTTGVVTGTLSATDADGDALTFTAPASTTKGAVTISGSTFVYAPTASARQQAASDTATAADKQDTFVVTVSDGRGGSDTFTVGVAVAPAVTAAPTTVNNLGTKTVSGTPLQAAISSDGTRAVVLTAGSDNNRIFVATFNTSTGAKVGATAELAGSGGTIQFNSTGTRAVILISGSGNSDNDDSVAVFDAASGAQVGSTVALGLVFSSVYSSPSVLITPDGTRALLVSSVPSDAGSTGETTYSSGLTSINLVNGAVVYRTTVPGTEYAYSSSFSADGARAAITTVAGDNSNGDFSSLHTTVTFIDTATGQIIGSSVQVTGQAGAALNGDGSRAVISAITGDTATGSASDLSTVVRIIDPTTGESIGSPLTFVGYYQPAVMLGLPAQFATGDRAVVSLLSLPSAQLGYQSAIAIIDLTTGGQVGSTVTLPGAPASISDGQATLGGRVIDSGARVMLVTYAQALNGDGSVSLSSNLALIDVATGNQVGTTISSNSVEMLTTVSADGSHIVVTAMTISATANDYTVHMNPEIRVVDSNTGASTVMTVAGLSAVALNSDGTRLVAISSDGTNTAVTTFDTATGQQVHPSVSVAGTSDALGAIYDFVYGVNNIHGGYAIVTTAVNSTTMNLAFIDANSGAQVGTTVSFAGSEPTGTTLQPSTLVSDGTHTVVLTLDTDGTGTNVTLLSLT